MDNVWIGRRLMSASPALAERYRAGHGAGEKVLGSIAQRLLHEIGLALVLEEKDPALPFVRTRGLLRIPSSIGESALVDGFKSLARLVGEYLMGLPGTTPEMTRFALLVVRQASQVATALRRDLLDGQHRPETEQRFGGLALLLYTAQPGVVELQATG